MNEHLFKVEYKGKTVICSCSTSVSEISCSVYYTVKVEGEKPAHIEYETEGDSDLSENYSSGDLNAEFKESVRKALNKALSK